MASNQARRQFKVIKTRIHYGMRVDDDGFSSVDGEPCFTVSFRGVEFTGVIMIPRYIRYKTVWTGHTLVSVEGWNGWPGR